jgi:hypothetical protein
MTSANETDCHNKRQDGRTATNAVNGSAGNLCHVDCSNRGVCDYETGLCTCFEGFYGGNCNITEALAGLSEGFVASEATFANLEL